VNECYLKVNVRRIRLLTLFVYSMAFLLSDTAFPAVSDGGDEAGAKEPGLMYPVNIRPAGEAALSMEAGKTADGNDVVTVIGRFYIWQKQKENCYWHLSS